MKDEAWEKTAKFKDGHFRFVGREKICFSLTSRIVTKNLVEKISDYGCGTGKPLQELREVQRRKEIGTADIFSKTLDCCRRRGIPRVYYPEEVESRSNYFGLITCLDVLEHVYEGQSSVRRRR